MRIILIILSLFIGQQMLSQSELDFDGQLSYMTSLNPESSTSYLTAVRYIPKFSYKINIDTNAVLDFEAAINMLGVHQYNKTIGKFNTDADINAYRLWARYTNAQFEARIGLQKIDFGSASLLRPLQWFNEIDPRDPLGLTNGVWGILGRYYFLNNANIWVWGLYGNEKTRGLELFESNPKIPEYGTRIQFPVRNGELGINYHYRVTSTKNSPLQIAHLIRDIPEHKVAIDGKWDWIVGFWTEMSITQKEKDIGIFTTQKLITIGIDYTFGIGNGMNITVEHLLGNQDTDLNKHQNKINTTALLVNYPISFFDNIAAITYYNYNSESLAFFIDYAHQFSNISGHFMVLYNPKNTQNLQPINSLYDYQGLGLRLMFIYNH